MDIPPPDEIKRILGIAQGRWRPILVTVIFTGLRASELRGLRWVDIDLKVDELHIRQRVDRWNAIGLPKSETSERIIPLGPFVLNTLKEWKLACPKSAIDLAFPNGSGHVENHGNILRRGLWPLEIEAGVSVCKRGPDGEPITVPKYTGLHALRHFYASWCINRRTDGGLELPIKVVQERLGHSSMVMTSDVYGHLFPRQDDGAELTAAEHALLGSA